MRIVKSRSMPEINNYKDLPVAESPVLHKVPAHENNMQWRTPHTRTVMVLISSPTTLNDKRCVDLLGDSPSIPFMRHLIFNVSIYDSFDAVAHAQTAKRSKRPEPWSSVGHPVSTRYAGPREHIATKTL